MLRLFQPFTHFPDVRAGKWTDGGGVIFIPPGRNEELWRG